MKNASKTARKIVADARQDTEKEIERPPEWMRIAFAGAHGPGTRQAANRQHARQVGRHPANPRRG